MWRFLYELDAMAWGMRRTMRHNRTHTHTKRERERERLIMTEIEREQ
jgi:hypothetical protein